MSQLHCESALLYMPSRRTHSINVAVVVLLVILLIVCHLGVFQITRAFIQMREADAIFFHDLIADNYDRITSIPRHKKETVLDNLLHGDAAADIRLLRTFILVLLYVCFLPLIANRAMACAQTNRK